jgi:hypothetical protein
MESSNLNLRLEIRLSLLKSDVGATLKHLSEGWPDLSLNWFYSSITSQRPQTVAGRSKSKGEGMRPEARTVSAHSEQPILQKLDMQKIHRPWQPCALSKILEKHSVIGNSLAPIPSFASLFKVGLANERSDFIRALAKPQAENRLAVEWPHRSMGASAEREHQSGATNQLSHSP